MRTNGSRQIHKYTGDIIEPQHEISNNVVCGTSKGSDQHVHTHSLTRAFASVYSMTLRLLTSFVVSKLKTYSGCTGSSDSTLDKMPHCWKSHVPAHFYTSSTRPEFLLWFNYLWFELEGGM